MLAQIPDPLRGRILFIALLCCAAGSLVSCATKEEMPLVDDPNGKRESTIPWNRQEKWEQGAGVPGLTDRPH